MIYDFGSIIILCSYFVKYGVVTIIKCHLNILLISLGLSLNLIPSFSKLVINFPVENKFSNWVNRHNYGFLLIFILIDLILNALSYINSFDVKRNIIEEGENFQFYFINSNSEKSKIIKTGELTQQFIIVISKYSTNETSSSVFTIASDITSLDPSIASVSIISTSIFTSTITFDIISLDPGRASESIISTNEINSNPKTTNFNY
eukprot:jgi/Orpsp1_1/1184466/evm.model.c7180000089650.1